MTVEQINGEQFPSGLRVLAVDDDRTCLKVLESLLRHCQYHVTTTSQAITALKLLRENRNKYDLVITDVYMPDMDGFKLLELVGLETDLPVIMMSGNGDPKLVMKGITHGACDYLLKPVRIQELKNIWQHVVRRKKFDTNDRTNSANQDQPNCGSDETGGMGNSDQNGKLSEKRKDQNEDEERGENEHEKEDPTTQKKPRVVWSVELHRKFVAAVNQLGIDKAAPEKILDLMNVEKLTRENLASHLQKYRLYLKRFSCVANQQANMVAALGSTDPPYLRMSSVNGLGNFHTIAGTGQFQNNTLRSFPPSGMLGRLNTPAALGMHGLPSSGMIQLCHAQNLDNSANDQGKFHSALLPGSHRSNILQGMPTSLELNQLQRDKNISSISELPDAKDNTTVFPVFSSFQGMFSTNSLDGVVNHHLMLEGHPQEAQGSKMFGNQSLVSLNSGSSSHLLDHGRRNDNWPRAVQPSGIEPNTFPLGDYFKQPSLHPSDLRDNFSTMAFQIGNKRCDVSSLPTMANRLMDSKADLQFPAVQDAPYRSNVLCNPLYSTMPINSDMGHLGQSLDPNKAVFHRGNDFDSVGHSNFIDPFPMKINEVQRSIMHTSLNLKEGYLIGQQKTQGSYISNRVDSLADLVSSMVKEKYGHYIKRASCMANGQKQWLKLLLLLLCIFALFLLVFSRFHEHFGVFPVLEQYNFLWQ